MISINQIFFLNYRFGFEGYYNVFIMDIDVLPNEIWLKILKKLNSTDLDNLLFVNKRFHSLAFEISSNLVINHDSSLKNDNEILERIRHYKEIFVKCGTNDHISKVLIVNKTKSYDYCQETNDRGNFADSRKSKSMLVNLIPQFRGMYFIHQDASFLNELMKVIFEFCYNVQSITFIEINLTDDHLKYISERIMKRIQYFKIIGCDRITNNALKYIGMQCDKLEYLNLKDCFHISDTGLFYIIKKSPAIKYLELSGTCISNIGICLISQYCPDLKSMIISRCRKLTCEGFQDAQQGFKCLEHLNISSNHERMTDKGIVILVQKCVELKCLDISHSPNLTNISVFSIADCCKTLTAFIAKDCPNITEEAVIYLVRKHHTLETINISKLKISNHLLITIANNCPNLVDLNIKKSFSVRHYQEGIQYIVKKCVKLEIFCYDKPYHYLLHEYINL